MSVLKATHTPGPWEACDSELWGDGTEDVLVAGADSAGEDGNLDNEIAIVRGQYVAEARDANVRLIIAAPDLLAACEALPLDCEFEDAADFKDNSRRFLHAMELARAAIAKARGGAA